MPIVIPKDIPAYKTLKDENVFVLTEKRAFTQDIRPIEIAILNLMPIKWETETQLMRLLSNTPLQVNLTLIATASYTSSHTTPSHMQKFYREFEKIKDKHYDGMIITGAPVENIAFEQVQYWNELQEIMAWSKKHVTSKLYICWGAQAGLQYFFNIDKRPLEKKMFGVFPHTKTTQFDPLLKGMNDIFYIPNSRHTEVCEEQIYKNPKLQVLARSEESGIGIVKTIDNKMIFFMGHSEYERDTLKNEYERDLSKGLAIEPPKHYFSDDGTTVKMRWQETANVLFSNWLNYYVYQVTPYDIEKIK